MSKKTERHFLAAGLSISIFMFLQNSGVLHAEDKDEIELISTEIDLEGAVRVQDKKDSSDFPGRRIDVKPVSELAVLSPDEQHIIKINQSLKNAVEENKKLLEEKEAIEAELKQLRGDQEIKANRIRTLTSQRDSLTERADKAEQLQRQYSEELNQLKTTLTQKESEYTTEIKELQQEVAKKKEIEELIPWSSEIIEEIKVSPAQPAAPDQLSRENIKLKIDSVRLVEDLKKQAQANLRGMEGKIKSVASKMAELKTENQRLKADSAKLHYNLGNIFFEQQKYTQAVKEYRRVVEFAPHDPAAHYNLAFVSGEFLNDHETAKEHYERYLALNPDAEDAYLVREKLLAISLMIQTNLGPPLEKKLTGKKLPGKK